MGAPRIDRLQNGIINAPLELWQRVGNATTTINTATPVSGATADRVLYGTSGGTVKNFSLQRDASDVPSLIGTGNHPPSASYRINCLTAITSPAAGDLVNPWQYRIEGYDYYPYHGNAVTFSFRIKVTSTATFPIQVPVAIGNNSRSYVTTVQVDANSTWQQCFVNLTLESGGSYNFDNTLGIKITIASGAVGSNFIASSANTWLAGDFQSVSGAFNSMGVNTNVIRIACPQLVLGTLNSATGLRFARAGRNIAHEIELSRRYGQYLYGGVGVAINTTTTDVYAAFVPEMRAIPTPSVIGGNVQISDQFALDFNQSSPSVSAVAFNARGGRCRCGNFTGLTVQRFYSYENDGAGQIFLDAEL